jgi:hypothetical protein
MTATLTPALESLIGYLVACGGSDRYEFVDAANEPDPVAARAYAENLRSQLGLALGSVAKVEQSGNRVMLTLVEATV